MRATGRTLEASWSNSFSFSCLATIGSPDQLERMASASYITTRPRKLSKVGSSPNNWCLGVITRVARDFLSSLLESPGPGPCAAADAKRPERRSKAGNFSSSPHGPLCVRASGGPSLSLSLSLGPSFSASQLLQPLSWIYVITYSALALVGVERATRSLPLSPPCAVVGANGFLHWRLFGTAA